MSNEQLNLGVYFPLVIVILTAGKLYGWFGNFILVYTVGKVAGLSFLVLCSHKGVTCLLVLHWSHRKGNKFSSTVFTFMSCART